MKTLQELLEAIKPMLKEDVVNDETQWGSIAEGVDSVVNHSVSGVIKNKEEILAEKKTLQEKYEQLEGSLDKVRPFIDNEVSYDKYQQIVAEMEETQKKLEQNPDVAKLKQEYFEQGKRMATQELQPKLTAFEADKKRLEKEQIETREKYLRTLKKNELDRALGELNVKADDFWRAGFYQSAEAEYIEAEDRLSITLPHPTDPTIGRLPINDWKRIFPQTPTGQKLIPAPKNFGAGAPGSDGKGGGNKPLAEQLGDLFNK